MSSTATETARRLADAPAAYFKDVDALDVDAVLSHFAETATLTVQTDHVTFSGTDEIRQMFAGFFADWDSMVHTITNLVVDGEAGKVATEQHVTLRRNGATEMHNCNFFDVGEDGKFRRVIIWMDGANPLK
jgi:ketosteroid isomerase-like protein